VTVGGPGRSRFNDAEPVAQSDAPGGRAITPSSAQDTAPDLNQGGNRALARLLTDQEQSWANPSHAPAGSPALVGTIYFRTKEWSTDAQDEAVLRQLAKAYARWAMRNRVNSGGERGLRGRVVGYADPRPSVEPDNTTLSAERADIVARRLTRHLIAETHGLTEADFDIEKENGGVAPADPDLTDGPESLTPLGRLRRAEIYLDGQAAEPEPDQPELPPPAVEAVKHDDGWERWIPYIQQGDMRTINGVALQILAYQAYRGKFIKDVLKYTGTIPLEPKLAGQKMKLGPIFSYGKHGGTLPFQPVKPPDWDSRTSGYPSPPLGRRALDPDAVKRQHLIDQSLMLVGDQRRLSAMIDQTVGDGSSAYILFMEELRKDEPDVAKLREYAVPIQHLLFVFDAVKTSSIEVAQLTDQ
jgi:outer membrane protein OmpA-like peptidoglycan-associated protein